MFDGRSAMQQQRVWRNRRHGWGTNTRHTPLSARPNSLPLCRAERRTTLCWSRTVAAPVANSRILLHPPWPPTPPVDSNIVAYHRRLAEIIEMIHTASLVHDDVLDDCSTRRGEWRRLGFGFRHEGCSCTPLRKYE
jgi:geranylgeranyl pyrophosphate synthase